MNVKRGLILMLGVLRPRKQKIEFFVESARRNAQRGGLSMPASMEEGIRSLEPFAQQMSPYDPPWDSLILQTTFQVLHTRGGAISADGKERPVLSFLPVPSLNALTFKVPASSEYVVAFHRGVFALANLLANIVVSALPMEGDGQLSRLRVESQNLAEDLQQNARLQERFDDLLAAYVIEKEVSNAQLWTVPPQYIKVQNLVRDGMN